MQERLNGVSNATSPIATTGFRRCATERIAGAPNYIRLSDAALRAGKRQHALDLYVTVSQSAKLSKLLAARGFAGFRPGTLMPGMPAPDRPGMPTSSDPDGNAMPVPGMPTDIDPADGAWPGPGGAGPAPGGGDPPPVDVVAGDGNGIRLPEAPSSAADAGQGAGDEDAPDDGGPSGGPPGGGGGGGGGGMNSGPGGPPATPGRRALRELVGDLGEGGVVGADDAADGDDGRFVEEPWSTSQIVLWVIPIHVGLVDSAAKFFSAISENQISVSSSKMVKTEVQLLKSELLYLNGAMVDGYRIHSSAVDLSVSDPGAAMSYTKFLERQRQFNSSEWSSVLGFEASDALVDEIRLFTETRMRIANSTDSMFSLGYQSLRVERLVQTEKMTWEELVGGIGGWLSILWGASLHLILFHRGHGLVMYVVSLFVATVAMVEQQQQQQQQAGASVEAGDAGPGRARRKSGSTIQSIVRTTSAKHARSRSITKMIRDSG